MVFPIVGLHLRVQRHGMCNSNSRERTTSTSTKSKSSASALNNCSQLQTELLRWRNDTRDGPRTTLRNHVHSGFSGRGVWAMVKTSALRRSG